MALRSTCACMYTTSNSAESALTYEFLTRNYLSCNVNVVRYAYAHHSLHVEARDCRDPEKLLQIHREYMQSGVSDLRKNKRFADIKEIQRYHMNILEEASKCSLCLVESISIGRLLQIFLSGHANAKPGHKLCGLEIGITNWFLNTYRWVLRSKIRKYGSNPDQVRRLEREFDASSPFTY